ncbi:MAG: hypothetical protein R3A44_43425 [Caldilineaceae bacterium]
MTVKTISPEQTLDAPADKLDFLIEMVTSMRRDLDVILLRLEELEKDDFRDPLKSFESSWRDAQAGKTYPIETLWERVYAE